MNFLQFTVRIPSRQRFAVYKQRPDGGEQLISGSEEEVRSRRLGTCAKRLPWHLRQNGCLGTGSKPPASPAVASPAPTRRQSIPSPTPRPHCCLPLLQVLDVVDYWVLEHKVYDTQKLQQQRRMGGCPGGVLRARRGGGAADRALVTLTDAVQPAHGAAPRMLGAGQCAGPLRLPALSCWLSS